MFIAYSLIPYFLVTTTVITGWEERVLIFFSQTGLGGDLYVLVTTLDMIMICLSLVFGFWFFLVLYL